MLNLLLARTNFLYFSQNTKNVDQLYLQKIVSSGMLRHVAPTRATRRNIPEDTILHSHRRENLKPYIALSTIA
jgi:hypothetical protein